MDGVKRLVLTALAGLIVAGGVFAGGGSDKGGSGGAANGSKTYEINIAHIVNEDNIWHKASLFFKKEAESRSEGRIKVNIYPNSQLGTEMDAVNSIITDGGTDITLTGESMQSVIPEMGVLGVPYLLTSSELLNKVAAGPVGKQLEDLLLKNANMRVLGYFERGPRNVTSNKPIRSPSDMNGFVIRVSASPITVATWEAVGAKPVPMAFAEVFTALQQKTIDGQENPLAMIKTGNFNEVQRFLNKTEHLRTWIYFVLSETKFQSLPKDLQDLVIDAGKKTQAYEHELFLKDEAELEQYLSQNGMTIVSDVDQAAFVRQASAGVEKVLPPKIKPLYDQIKAMQ
ncbi:MAG: TRAP transporter substrate-binding protein [Treponema sp.]|nr:TRAP transporter substrate-binding protein [Treponema sp.]